MLVLKNHSEEEGKFMPKKCDREEPEGRRKRGGINLREKQEGPRLGISAQTVIGESTLQKGQESNTGKAGRSAGGLEKDT